uniref:Uncharacterized protein n=1 Tax=Lactuca sativa TaxID=4236 RepID=A0A9R1XHT0_LACSA|nr:hypothetical protein LSAT_V11C300139680 [Lactuca sativa]
MALLSPPVYSWISVRGQGQGKKPMKLICKPSSIIGLVDREQTDEVIYEDLRQSRLMREKNAMLSLHHKLLKFEINSRSLARTKNLLHIFFKTKTTKQVLVYDNM